MRRASDVHAITRSAPSPFEIETPAGAEGWQEMYPYYVLFSDERREFDSGKFWFYNGMHYPEPMPPFDLITAEAPYIAIGQFQSRVFSTPPVLGIDHRVVNGYVYLSTNTVKDPGTIQRRLEIFRRRAGYYYEHWDELLGRWHAKVRETTEDLAAVEIPDLPELEDDAVVFDAHGVGSGYRLLVAYNRCLEGYYKIWQLHCELLLLGYTAYLTFFEFCKKAFPDISQETIATMVSGFDVIMFRPDDELKRLARVAIELGVDAALSSGAPAYDILHGLESSPQGRKWLAELDKSKDPWFNVSTGDGFYHHHRSWADDLSFPLSAISNYALRLRAGEMIDRDVAALQRERDRVTAEYQGLLPTDGDRQVFTDTLNLARLVFPHVEEHKFYCEHWGTTVFFNKVRELGELLTKHGFFGEPDDVFLLHHREVSAALSDVVLAWSGGSPARGPGYWPPILARRKKILTHLAKWNPPPALGPVPEEVRDPLLTMLWGITAERLREWAAPLTPDASLRGYPASPGVCEGTARVVRSVDEIGAVQHGEILICQVTAPSWAPIFTKVKAAVSDIGGMMSHAAIVAREYGMPAVVGTGHATRLIRTGQRVRVDGSSGVVEILADGEVR